MLEQIIKPGTRIGEGGRAFVVEKVTKETIYVHGAQEGNPLRLIPTELIEIITQAIKDQKISLQDISRRYRSDNNLPHLFDALELNYDKFILGYDSTIQKLCEFVLENPPNIRHQTAMVSTTQLPKPFLLLAGISGTGKSRFVREQADLHNLDRANFCLVAVRPDWHEPGDLLGYVSRLSGTASYVATDVLRFMVAAWKALYNHGLSLEESGEQTTRLTGATSQLDSVAPYWLCLDEMNLAPVEQYFADYLALIETRDWKHRDDSFTYSCDALLKPSVLAELGKEAQQVLAENLGLEGIAAGEADHALWQHFLQHGIAIPPNLIVAGTVNMDETTHGFSRKVIDRAMSFDFGQFFPNNFDNFYPDTISHVALGFPRRSSGRDAIKENAAKPSIEFLKAVNAVLKNSPFELAFRALNELLLAVDCHGAPAEGAELQAVWDDFLMQKVLPRIEGDTDKLQGNNDNNNLLTRLRDVLENQLADIWADDKKRTDFYRTKDGLPAKTGCRSRQKIDWMLARLNSSGFTSFWP